MKNNFLVLIIFLLPFVTIAQNPLEEQSNLSLTEIEPEEIRYFSSNVFDGKVIINQSSELEKLIGIQKAVIKMQKGFEGYRIRLFASVGQKSRRKANQVRIEFIEIHPDIKAYLVYNNPNWEVHIGDYRNRFEAMHDLDKITEEYPNAFIVSSYVEFPELVR